MTTESKCYVIASCSIGLGLIAGCGVLLLTTLAWARLADTPQLPTVLFFIAMLLLTFGCHKLDCFERDRRGKARPVSPTKNNAKLHSAPSNSLVHSHNLGARTGFDVPYARANTDTNSHGERSVRLSRDAEGSPGPNR